MNTVTFELGYVFASIFFIIGLKLLNKAKTARVGNILSIVGMVIAIACTFKLEELHNVEWIWAAMILGAGVGWIAGHVVEMTAMPEMVAIFNGFGGLASLLVATAGMMELTLPEMSLGNTLATFFAVAIGGVTFTGSVIAYAKLAGKMRQGAITFGALHKILNYGLTAYLLIATFFGPLYIAGYLTTNILYSLIGLSCLLGVLLVIPIGGADMPVVISLLNSYSGLAACATGFIVMNNVLIVAGALVGASGLILTRIMCKAMNRSLANVVFGNFQAVATGKSGGGEAKNAHPIDSEDTYTLLEAAQQVVIIPGYGMAVAQAQHAVKELADLLQKNDTEVKYAIHPVAGRMPGHMNVLLAEANVDYEDLVRPEDVNPVMEQCDVAIVVGANDVVNPAAKEEESSPLYGMPIIEADRARTVIILKRSMAAGFSGVDNDLFFRDNTRMLFGDAKKSINALVAAFKGQD